MTTAEALRRALRTCRTARTGELADCLCRVLLSVCVCVSQAFDKYEKQMKQAKQSGLDSKSNQEKVKNFQQQKNKNKKGKVRRPSELLPLKLLGY
eukprot:7943181-Pyramimonas_sp.AAC.2